MTTVDAFEYLGVWGVVTMISGPLGFGAKVSDDVVENVHEAVKEFPLTNLRDVDFVRIVRSVIGAIENDQRIVHLIASDISLYRAAVLSRMLSYMFEKSCGVIHAFYADADMLVVDTEHERETVRSWSVVARRNIDTDERFHRASVAEFDFADRAALTRVWIGGRAPRTRGWDVVVVVSCCG
jgi:hypothetical protein